MNKRISLNLIGQLCSFVFSMGISFLLTPFIVSTLGKETYGFVGLANNVTNYITLFTVAISGMLSRYVTLECTKKDYKEASRYFATAYITEIGLALVLLIPMVLISLNVDHVVNVSAEIVPDVRLLWLLVFLAFLGNLAFGGFNVATFAKNRLEISSVISILTNLLRAAVMIAAFMFFPAHVWYVGLAAIISNIFNITATYIAKRKLLPELKVSFKYFNFKYIWRLIVVGVWNSLNKLQQILYTGLDLLLTNLFINGAEMGLLSIAKTVPTQISTLISTISGAFEPSMTIAYAKDDKTDFLSTTKFAMRLSGFLCSVPILGFIAFGTKFYSLWMPSLEHSEIIKVQILAVLTLFPQIFSVYIYPLYAVNTITTKLKVPVLLSVAIGCANVIIVFILLKTTSLGVYAVAGVSSVLWIMRIFSFVPTYAAWSLGMKLNTFYPPLMRGVVNVFITGGLLCAISYFTTASSWIALFAQCAAAGIIGYMCCFFIMFNKEDRIKAVGMLKKKLAGRKTA